MGCHYETVPDLGKVLIPGCIAVSVHNDLDMCTCHTYGKYKLTDAELINKLKKEIKDLKTKLKQCQSKQ